MKKNIQMNTKMTHGEQWYQNKIMISACDEISLQDAETGCPERMSRAEAAKYYNAKLFLEWLKMLDDSLPNKKRKELVSYLMFRDPKKYKELVS